MKLCASRAFWLVAYPSQGHEMLFDAHTRSFAALGGVAAAGHLRQHEDGGGQGQEGQGPVVNERFAPCARTTCSTRTSATSPAAGRRASSRRTCRTAAGASGSRRQSSASAASPNSTPGWAERCRALWQEVRHPEHGQFSVAEMLEHERAHLMPMPAPFDGYVEKPARCPAPAWCRWRATATRCRASCSARWSARGCTRRRRDRGRRPHGGQPRPAEQRRRDALRLAALHPAAAEEARVR
jgi:hypothetical protein